MSDAIAAEPYAGEMVRGAYASALTHDRLLVIAETDGSRPSRTTWCAACWTGRSTGWCTAASPPAGGAVAAVAELPVVLLNCVADPLPGPAVVPDEVGGGREAARGLLAPGTATGST